MPGLCFRTSKWIDRLWSEHLEVSKPGRDLVAEGVRKQGDCFGGFGADLVARLYLVRDPAPTDTGPEWATKIHAQAAELAEWKQLRLMTNLNGFSSGIAAEVVLERLLPLVPERPEIPAEQAQPEAEGQTEQPTPEAEGPTEPPPPPQGGPGDGNEGGQGNGGGGESFPAPSDAELRATLRRAARAARDAVESAESGIEGMATSLGLSGSANIRKSGPADLKAIRDAHSRLKKSQRLRRIAERAGRLERMAISKARSRVRPGIGEVYGVGLGGNLSRVLPSELVALRHPALRRMTLAKIVEGRAQSYLLEGREPAGRGPIIVLLDESASMREQGKEVWAKAVALALLSTATRQKRSWYLLAFNGAVRREVCIPHGRATPRDIEAALDHSCLGGTKFDPPITRAIDLVKTSKVMKKADLVAITDGESSLKTSTVDSVTALSRSEGLSVYVVGVGKDAERSIESLSAIATEISVIRNVEREGDDIVDVINLETKANKAAPVKWPERSY